MSDIPFLGVAGVMVPDAPITSIEYNDRIAAQLTFDKTPSDAQNALTNDEGMLNLTNLASTFFDPSRAGSGSTSPALPGLVESAAGPLAQLLPQNGNRVFRPPRTVPGAAPLPAAGAPPIAGAASPAPVASGSGGGGAAPTTVKTEPGSGQGQQQQQAQVGQGQQQQASVRGTRRGGGARAATSGDVEPAEAGDGGAATGAAAGGGSAGAAAGGRRRTGGTGGGGAGGSRTGGGGGSGQGAAGRGRKPKDYLGDLKTVADEFAESNEETVIFFGSEYKVGLKRFEDLNKSTGLRAKKAVIAEEVVSLRRVLKYTNAVHVVLTAIQAYGLRSDQFKDAFDAQETVLSLEPVVEVRWPKHLLWARHKLKISKVECKSTWIQFVASAEMLKAGILQTHIQAEQDKLVGEKICLMLKLDPYPNMLQETRGHTERLSPKRVKTFPPPTAQTPFPFFNTPILPTAHTPSRPIQEVRYLPASCIWSLIARAWVLNRVRVCVGGFPYTGTVAGLPAGNLVLCFSSFYQEFASFFSVSREWPFEDEVADVCAGLTVVTAPSSFSKVSRTRSST